MSSKLKIILIVLLFVIVGFGIIGASLNADPHKEIDVSDIKEVTLYYRYAAEEKHIDGKVLEAIVYDFNSSESFDKVYSEELPCYSVTLRLKGGEKVVFVDIHSDDSILIERVFFGKTTKYELYDKELLQAVKKLIEESFELHENEVCKKYL